MEEKKTDKKLTTSKETPKAEKAEEVVEIPVGKAMDKLRKNPWIVSTIFLALVLVAVIIWASMSGGFGSSTTSVSAATAGDNVVKFINSNPSLQGQVSIVSTEKQDSLYKVTLSYQGQDVPVYATLDGKYLVSNVVPLNTPINTTTPEQTPAKEVPKTDKPVVEAFVFSYCPYGLQFEKALGPAYDLLKSKANISIVFIGAMHDPQGCSGAACFEKTESLRQLCIQKIYGKDKLFSYLAKFTVNTTIGNCQGDATCLAPLLQTIYTQTGINKAQVESCMAKDAEALYTANMARASALGISGSPGFVINDVEVQVNRSPDAIKTAICNAFTTAPSQCNQTLSTAAASAGFGGTSGTASASSTASC